MNANQLIQECSAKTAQEMAALGGADPFQDLLKQGIRQEEILVVSRFTKPLRDVERLELCDQHAFRQAFRERGQVHLVEVVGASLLTMLYF